MNFFHWIRDGVRQAVLMGVSDAVGDLGTPREDDDISQRLLERLRSGQPALSDESAAAAAQRAPRKKLGRSLEQIQSGLSKAG